ncbi:uncharacterized protein LOC128033913 [Gossypium raimondii]|uniref:uncharacterized protein LOC128033913 n=1 Tax=Gossypium raimondii TaxID=29730 RepID=UPI00227D03AF|nr:uncharacterized protein LOC128033913 [Gossypium raimondii]
MTPYEAFYGHKCCTLLCWAELGERRIMGLDLVFKTEDKVRLIRDCLKAASDRQKSYADLKRKDIMFVARNQIFIKVSSWKKVLRRYHFDPSHIVPIEEIEVRADLTFEEEPIQILDQKVNVLRKKTISLVKVLLQNHGINNAT